MLYYLSQLALDSLDLPKWLELLLRLLRYITVRAAGAAVTALAVSWWLGPRVICWLKQLKFGQEYQDKAELGGISTRMISKKGTPTMGGILIILALNITTLIWAQLNALVLLALLSVVVLFGLGFYDDYAKITKQNGGGAKSQVKLWVQGLLAVFIGGYLWMILLYSRTIKAPKKLVCVTWTMVWC